MRRAKARSVPVRRLLTAVAAIAVAASHAGCGADDSLPSITVLAAASLERTFTELGEQFKARHPGTGVRFDFASSSDLAAQLSQGAAGDVFASADNAQMDKVVQTGLAAGEPVNFASNSLVIVTAPDNPKHIASFADLADPGVDVVVSPPPMPCGVATRQIEDTTGVRLNPISEEPHEQDVLNKVVTGQADAGMVNITDAIAAGDKVATVTFPEAATAVTTYPVAVLEGAAQPGLARRFVDLIVGEHGQQILARAGFGKATQ